MLVPGYDLGLPLIDAGLEMLWQLDEGDIIRDQII